MNSSSSSNGGCNWSLGSSSGGSSSNGGCGSTSSGGSSSLSTKVATGSILRSNYISLHLQMSLLRSSRPTRAV